MGLLDGILGGMSGNSAGAPQQAPVGAGMGGGNGVLMALLPVLLGMLMNRQGGATTGAGRGGLADLVGGMLGGRGGGLGDVLEGMLGGAAGGTAGLGGLLEQFQRAGFAEQAQSWVGTGQNLPISPAAVGQVLGSDTLSQIAQQAGVSEAEASEGLSQLLPEVVDHLTPDGSAPGLDQLAASVAALTRQFGG